MVKQKKEKGQCRFCLQFSPIHTLITPCLCKGSAMYIHRNCLIKWIPYKKNRINQCNECHADYAQVYPDTYETSIELFKKTNAYIAVPVVSVCAHHWSFVLIHLIFFPKYDFHTMYMYFQYIFQIAYMLYFFYLISCVKQKSRYIAMWLLSERVLLPIMHIGLLCILNTSLYMSGFSSNMFVYIYFYEHYTLLNTINTVYKPIFVNRPLEGSTL